MEQTHYGRTMERDDLLAFLRAQKWAMEASVSVHGTPQAAVIGIAVTDDLEIVFDTNEAARKTANLRRNPRVALVVGWDDARTVQLEGLADEPRGAELERLKAVYFARFPDGPERAAREPLTYFRVRPRWVRVSDFTGPEPKITVMEFGGRRPREAPAARVVPEPAAPEAQPEAPEAFEALEAPEALEALEAPEGDVPEAPQAPEAFEAPQVPEAPESDVPEAPATEP